MKKITFDNKQNPFFRSLKLKVDQYFQKRNIAPTGDFSLYIKGALQICTASALYFILVFLHPDVFLSCILWTLLGANLALLGFNIMHEGAHQSFSKTKWVNKLSAYFLNVLGGNAYFWNMKHNIAHHTYTNIEGMDDDIEVKPFMRLHAEQPKYWIHRFQHFYWVILYGMSYFAWVYIKDFVKYFSGKFASGHQNQKLSFKEHTIFWSTKVVYTLVFLVLPSYFIGWPATLIGFTIMMFACGLTLGIVFQMAHVVEETSFPMPNTQTLQIEQEWAMHQVQTTANFGTKSKMLSWLLGGLNFQVEHHLFPKISHIHYPAINKLVKETCAEFNVKYIEYPSLGLAFVSHLKLIKSLGQH